MYFTRSHKEWTVMKEWVQNNYSSSIKRLAKDNDLNYNRLLKINKKLYKVNDIMEFIDSKIQKYFLSKVVEQVVEEVIQHVEERIEPLYQIEKDLDNLKEEAEEREKSLNALDDTLGILIEKVRFLEEKNNSIYTINTLLFLLSFYRICLQLYEYIF